MDFTLNMYRRLCETALSNGYRFQTVASHLQDDVKYPKIIIMRHDVDRLPKRALKMSALEKTLDIKSTYYFRTANFGDKSIIEGILDQGQEIGYHYETLDEAKGDYELAFLLFKKHLGQLRGMAPVQTVCMHGAPFTRWLNSDIWKRYDFRPLNIIGEAFLSIRNVYYLSDTGRKWDMSKKIKDNLLGGLPLKGVSPRNVIRTEDVIDLVAKGLSPIYLTVHCERWSSNIVDWGMDLVKDSSINLAKTVFKAWKSK